MPWMDWVELVTTQATLSFQSGDAGALLNGDGLLVLRSSSTRNAVLVEFDDVSKTYDGVSLAVANLNLSIVKGEFLTLLGPSGSGKMTSLMMLAGLKRQPPATSGSVAGRPF